MAENPIIRVLKWDEFQHYKDRSPPWIKLHRSLLTNRQWHELSGDASKLLAECWLLASESEDGTIELSTEDLAWQRRRDPVKVAGWLQELERQGFMDLSDHDASAVLARCKQPATPEGEGETEGESTSTSLRSVDAENPNGSLTGGEVLGWWLELQETRPPDSDVGKQGAAAKRLAEKCDREQIVQAFVGIEQMFPYSKGEPWDLFDLEKKLPKALQAAHNHPEVKKHSRIAELREKIARVRP